VTGLSSKQFDFHYEVGDLVYYKEEKNGLYKVTISPKEDAKKVYTIEPLNGNGKINKNAWGQNLYVPGNFLQILEDKRAFVGGDSGEYETSELYKLKQDNLSYFKPTSELLTHNKSFQDRHKGRARTQDYLVLKKAIEKAQLEKISRSYETQQAQRWKDFEIFLARSLAEVMAAIKSSTCNDKICEARYWKLKAEENVYRHELKECIKVPAAEGYTRPDYSHLDLDRSGPSSDTGSSGSGSSGFLTMIFAVLALVAVFGVVSNGVGGITSPDGVVMKLLNGGSQNSSSGFCCGTCCWVLMALVTLGGGAAAWKFGAVGKVTAMYQARSTSSDAARDVSVEESEDASDSDAGSREADKANDSSEVEERSRSLPPPKSRIPPFIKWAIGIFFCLFVLMVGAGVYLGKSGSKSKPKKSVDRDIEEGFA